MRILVTRPEPFAAETTRALSQLGHTVTQIPLLNITYHPLPHNFDVSVCDALVITSYQALFTPGIDCLKHLPLWGVGVMKKFQTWGWQPTYVSHDVQSLVQRMPAHQRWLYVRGARITQPLPMPHTEHIGYTATPISSWPHPIDWENLDAVMLMSRETARTFMDLAQPESVCKLTALCHSKAIADVVSVWPWKHIQVGFKT